MDQLVACKNLWVFADFHCVIRKDTKAQNRRVLVNMWHITSMPYISPQYRKNTTCTTMYSDDMYNETYIYHQWGWQGIWLFLACCTSIDLQQYINVHALKYHIPMLLVFYSIIRALHHGQYLKHGISTGSMLLFQHSTSKRKANLRILSPLCDIFPLLP